MYSKLRFETYLFLLFVEVINDDTNEQVESKEGSENDEEDKVEVHVDVDFPYGLLKQLEQSKMILELRQMKKQVEHKTLISKD